MSSATDRGADKLHVTRQTRIEELPEYLSPQEVCTYMNLGRTLLYEMVRCGQLRHIKFGRLIRIPKWVIVDFATPNGKRE